MSDLTDQKYELVCDMCDGSIDGRPLTQHEGDTFYCSSECFIRALEREQNGRRS